MFVRRQGRVTKMPSPAFGRVGPPDLPPHRLRGWPDDDRVEDAGDLKARLPRRPPPTRPPEKLADKASRSFKAFTATIGRSPQGMRGWSPSSGNETRIL